MKKRALFSVSDKTGVVECARRVAALGYEILSTGGTLRTLEAGGVTVSSVSGITDFPECLDGRLKTLHPMIHGGILAVRSNPDHMAQLELLGIEPIDLVVINLYPFKQTILREGVKLAESIENIDIGGPALIRSAAKNWQDVVVLVDPGDYDAALTALENGELTPERRFELAVKVFEYTAHYDALIASYLREEIGGGYSGTLTLTYEKAQDLRYGENPHQSAAFYRDVAHMKGTPAAMEQLHGHEMSFNNFHDFGAAVDLTREFDGPCAVIVRHAEPCGVGLGETIFEAWQNASASDEALAFGGVIALSRPCDERTAEDIIRTSYEIVCAPGYTDEALAVLTRVDTLRVLLLDQIYTPNDPFRYDLRRVTGGLLIQNADTAVYEPEVTTVTQTLVTPEQRKALDFAWKVAKHVRSNAVVVASENRTLGIGGGQTSRLLAVEQALRAAGDSARGAVLASDAFFPFADCVELAAKAGIAAIIQTGGSVRDAECIEICNQHGIAMILTHMRHFRH